jgi:thiamine pyrophosphokinase
MTTVETNDDQEKQTKKQTNSTTVEQTYRVVAARYHNHLSAACTRLGGRFDHLTETVGEHDESI